MPGSTPNFSIVYPCAGETIDASVFQSNAESTQDALDTVAAAMNSFLRPPVALARRFITGQVVAAGVTTVLSYDTEVYDTGSLFTLAAPTVMTIVTPGTYMASLQWDMSISPTTLTSTRIAILVNGVEQAPMKSDKFNFNPDIPLTTSLLVPSAPAGTTISATTLFTGSGNMTCSADLHVARVSTF